MVAAVRIRFFGQLGRIMGKEDLQLEVSGPLRLLDLIRMLSDEFKEFRKIVDDENKFRAHYLIFIDGVDAEILGGLNAPVDPGATVDIVPIGHGG
jgi:molybdopterin converting factor small subunit